MEVAVLDTFKTNAATSPDTTVDSKPQVFQLTIAQLVVIYKEFLVPGFRFLLIYL